MMDEQSSARRSTLWKTLGRMMATDVLCISQWALEEEDEVREVEGRPGLLYRYMDIVPFPILSLMYDCNVIFER